MASAEETINRELERLTERITREDYLEVARFVGACMFHAGVTFAVERRSEAERAFFDNPTHVDPSHPHQPEIGSQSDEGPVCAWCEQPTEHLCRVGGCGDPVCDDDNCQREHARVVHGSLTLG